jgi:hypothetical protein
VLPPPGASCGHVRRAGHDADDMVYFHDTNMDEAISFEEVLTSWQMFMCAVLTHPASLD